MLERQKREMTDFEFSAQYQQAPVPAEGNLIKASWFGTYDHVPDAGETVLSIDTAYTTGDRNDWSVVSEWRVHANRYYLLNIWRDRVEYPMLVQVVRELARDVRPDAILIEDKGSGTGLIQDLRSGEEGFPVIAYDPGVYDKVVRLHVQSYKIRGGQVMLPPAAPWLEEFLKEVRRFPNGAHDDQIDTMAQLLAWKSEGLNDLIVATYRS